MQLRVTIQPDGGLKLTADNAMRAHIAHQLREGNRDRVLWDAFEDEINNGGFTPFDAGDANPFVGLTSAPCIAESMTTEDSGENVVIGRLWWFPDYMIRDELEELRDRGRVVYTLATEA